MGVRNILERLHGAIQNGGDYLVPTDDLPIAEREDARRISKTLEEEGPERARLMVEELYRSGAIDRVRQLSALHVIAASPRVRDYREALRLAGLQEFAALERGRDLERSLASVDRHRGVVAFLMGRFSVALEDFTRALERERSPENLGNVLAALLALGDRDEAEGMFRTVLLRFPTEFAEALLRRVRDDEDLRPLRTVDLRESAR